MTFSFEWHDKLSVPVEKIYRRGLATFLKDKSLGSAIMSWAILDHEVTKAYQEEKRESLDWKNQHYFLE